MSKSSLDKLSKSIQNAVDEVKRLRRENDRLKEKAARLEQRVEASPESNQAASWRQEREQIRGRVEKLAERLEAVLGES